MYTVIKELHFSYGHRLLKYEGKCRHLHGHNGRLEIHMRADSLDGRGMVVDFSEIKSKVAQWVEDELDHKMLLCKDDPALPRLREMGEPVFVMDENPTAENIAKLVFEHTRKQGLPVLTVRLWETVTSSATYSG